MNTKRSKDASVNMVSTHDSPLHNLPKTLTQRVKHTSPIQNATIYIFSNSQVIEVNVVLNTKESSLKYDVAKLNTAFRLLPFTTPWQCVLANFTQVAAIYESDKKQ